MIDLNATQAAIRAGYSPNGAGQAADKILKKIEVAEALDKAKAERARRTGINQDRVVRELARIAFVNPGQVINTEDATLLNDAVEDDLAAVQSVKVKVIPGRGGEDGIEREIKMADKVRALELLGKHLGLFTDRVDLSGDLDLNINIDYGTETEAPKRRKRGKEQ